MPLIDVVLLAIGLAMDCFAVSICIGSIDTFRDARFYLKIALHFGIFQGGMTLIGWLLGSRILNIIQNIDHWIAFILLAYVGVKMIIESKESAEQCPIDPSSEKTILMLAIATSIDALAVGVSMGTFPELNIGLDVAIIALASFLFTILGLVFGKKMGCRFGSRMEIIGGVILIAIGVRIVVSHLLVS